MANRSAREHLEGLATGPQIQGFRELETVDTVTWKAAIRHPDGPAGPTVRHVLLTLATWANRSGQNMFPSIELIAHATGLHRETVRRALEQAVKSRWIARAPRRAVTGDARKDAQIAGYHYRAAVPRGWPHLQSLDSWQSDPHYRSERKARRPRAEQGHVPAEGRDVATADVPVVHAERPGHESQTSLSTAGTVPVHDCINSGSNSGGTPSRTPAARAPEQGKPLARVRKTKSAAFQASRLDDEDWLAKAAAKMDPELIAKSTQETRERVDAAIARLRAKHANGESTP